MFGNLFILKLFLSLFLPEQLPMNTRKTCFSTSCEHREWGLNKILGVTGWKVVIETTAVSQNVTTTIQCPCLQSQIFPLFFETCTGSWNLWCNIPPCGSTGCNQEFRAKSQFCVIFCNRGLLLSERQHLQTTVSINLWKSPLVIPEVDLMSKPLR